MSFHEKIKQLMYHLRVRLSYRVYADWKVRENHIKISKSPESQGKSGKVREFEKDVVPGQGKSGKTFVKIFDSS